MIGSVKMRRRIEEVVYESQVQTWCKIAWLG